MTSPPGGWPELSVEISATAEQLAALRGAARRWMEAVEVPPELALDVLIALSEAATNAVLHAYEPGSAGRIRVLGQRGDDELESGGGGRRRLAGPQRPPRRARAGHHFDAVSSTANIERRAGGSRVVFRCPLRSTSARLNGSSNR